MSVASCVRNSSSVPVVARCGRTARLLVLLVLLVLVLLVLLLLLWRRRRAEPAERGEKASMQAARRKKPVSGRNNETPLRVIWWGCCYAVESGGTFGRWSGGPRTQARQRYKLWQRSLLVDDWTPKSTREYSS